MTLKDCVITQHIIFCFADGCSEEVRDTETVESTARQARRRGFVVRDEETFCAKHSEQKEQK